MTSSLNFSNENHRIKITTSKKWVLPPRPRASKKKVATTASDSLSAAVPSTAPRVNTPQQECSRRPPQPNHDTLANAIKNNPLKQAIITINEENYYLKLKVIKLVAELKLMQSEVSTQVPMEQPALNPSDILNKGTSNGRKRPCASDCSITNKKPIQLSVKKEEQDSCKIDELLSSFFISESESGTSFNQLTTSKLEEYQDSLGNEDELIIPEDEHVRSQKSSDESLTPNSLISLTHSNSTIDDELDLNMVVSNSLPSTMSYDADSKYPDLISLTKADEPVEFLQGMKPSSTLQVASSSSSAEPALIDDFLDFNVNYDNYDLINNDENLQFDRFINV
ncbi:BA75_04240T0 [Komagataella pastoris]|uniref:BA75_04240T0 n=1 Tax=Komagataella pastoris TaxID=4922 RepID=A0A1B2JF90_PICPA|nr:BA75_04240T0 [Komagataella pastoris]